MKAIDCLDIEPFEICSIRPPTENYSLTFRLTRNCYWNRCRFCPVYKCGARFSRRTEDEVIRDINRAKRIDDFLFEQGIGYPVYSEADFPKAAALLERVQRERWEAGVIDDAGERKRVPEGMDPRLEWFLSWFKDAPTLADSFNHIITWRMGGARTCFLGDADNLVLKPGFMKKIIAHAKAAFPALERFTIYGRTKTAAKLRTPGELAAFRKAGLDRVHYGLESGSDRVLALVDKGETAQDHIDGCRRTKDAGLSCSVYVMPGLGGAALSEEHARETARVINAIGPDFVRLRTLEIFAGTGLEGAMERGEFAECGEEQVAREIRTLVEEIGAETEILSDSASNLLDVSGRLPRDRDAMLGAIDAYLALSPRKKLEFSLRSRLGSYLGQYGNLPPDVYGAIDPFVQSGGLDLSAATDGELTAATRLIRSKLMP